MEYFTKRTEDMHEYQHFQETAKHTSILRGLLTVVMNIM